MIATSSINRTQLLISVSELKFSFCIINNHQIYLVRTPQMSNFNMENASDDVLFEKMLLEIQRSTDYCLSELKVAAPSEVIFSPSFLSQNTLLDYLKNHLSQTVSCIDLNKIIEFERDIPNKLQQSLFLSIGGALT